MWTRKLTVIGGQTREDDWIVLRHRQIVGRLHPAPSMPHVQPWQWFVFTYPGANGRCDTMDEALEAIRQAVRARWPDTLDSVPLAGTKG